MPRPASALAPLFLAAALAAGCGADEEAPADPGVAVRQVVERFGAATARKDYQTICDRLLARRLVTAVEQVGLPCEVALRRGLGEVEAPRLEIREVQVRGDRALVSVRSTAANQQPSEDAIELVRDQDEWRISSLAAPTGGTSTSKSTSTTTTTR